MNKIKTDVNATKVANAAVAECLNTYESLQTLKHSDKTGKNKPKGEEEGEIVYLCTTSPSPLKKSRSPKEVVQIDFGFLDSIIQTPLLIPTSSRSNNSNIDSSPQFEKGKRKRLTQRSENSFVKIKSPLLSSHSLVTQEQQSMPVDKKSPFNTALLKLNKSNGLTNRTVECPICLKCFDSKSELT